MIRRYTKRSRDSVLVPPSVVRFIRSDWVKEGTGEISDEGFRLRPGEKKLSAARLFHPRYAELSIQEQLPYILDNMRFRHRGPRDEFVRIFDSELENLGLTVTDDGSRRNPTHVSLCGEFNEEQISSLVKIANKRSRRYGVSHFIN